MFVTLDCTGATKVLAATLLADELEDTFRWVGETFRDAFHIPPRVIFTDSDPAMKAAFAAVLPESRHYLCIWHISKCAFLPLRLCVFLFTPG